MTFLIDDLLATKLEMPQLASRVVRRSRLTDILHSGLESKVSLVVAPPGYGKTTLLGEWIINEFSPGWRIAWVSLDTYDNEIARFWSYIAGAIHKIFPGLKTHFQQLVQPEPDRIDYLFLNPLINEISSCPHPICLVLDDYHVITHDRVHQSLGYFIDHQPKNFHLVISSRAVPPISLSRLRAQGQLIEVDASDLSFTSQEVNTFFTKVMDLEFGHEQVEAMANATEGWVAGLKLAALSVRHKKDIPNLQVDMNGLNRQIFDFLVEEVLNQQAREIQEFLLKTSVLSEFSGPLCDAVLNRSDSQHILEKIVHKNLFVIALDNRQNWYRYHQLFSETLRVMLQQTYPNSSRDIQEKACQWMRDNGYQDKAVSYALDAGNLECAAKIIDACALEAVTHFNITLFIQWINRLSPDLLKERPQLGIYVALAYFLLGKMDEVKPRLNEVEKSLRQTKFKGNEIKELTAIRWQIAALNATTVCFSDQIEDGIDQIMELLTCSPESDNYFVGNITHILAESYAVLGQLDKALEEYQICMDFALKHNLCFEYAYSLSGHAHVLKMLGQLTLADEDYQHMLRYANQCELSEIFKAYALTGRIEISIERGDLVFGDKFIADIEKHLDKIEHAPEIWIRLEFIYCRLAKYYFLRENFEKAQYYFSNALRRFLEKPSAVPFLSADLLDMQTRLWATLEKENKSSANFEERLHALNPYKRADIAEKTALARLYLSQNEYIKAEEILQEAHQHVRNNMAQEREIEILILRARCSLARNERNSALNYLTTALEIAESEGYKRLFIEEKQNLHPLLEEILLRLRQNPVPEYRELSAFIEQLVNDFKAEGVSISLDARESRSQAVLLSPFLESFSSREEEVISLLMNGKSTKEIAGELIISINTTKSHLQKIYKKLGVHTRNDALRVLEMMK